GNKGRVICPISFEQLNEGSTCLIVDCCKKVFDKDFLKNWLNKNDRCPNCLTFVNVFDSFCARYLPKKNILNIIYISGINVAGTVPLVWVVSGDITIHKMAFVFLMTLATCTAIQVLELTRTIILSDTVLGMLVVMIPYAPLIWSESQLWLCSTKVKTIWFKCFSKNF
ncbi:hypothetical protein LCGC14_2929670, partial [marine sediment metagenome]